ncbi:MAG: hypothetical protein ABH833_02630 [Parcubacteria group bacterium]
MPNKNKQKSNIATSKFVDIQSVRGPVLILKDGSMRAILEVESLNFELRSTDEKNAIIQAFQNFLNILDFPVQIIARSRRLDLTEYLEEVKGQMEKLTNESIRIQGNSYIEFVEGLTEQYNIVEKKFYVVIPYYATEMAFEQTGLKSRLKALFKPSATKSMSDKELEKYVTQLDQRVSLLSGSIEGLGLRTKILDYEKLVRLYYSYYNPRF